MENIYFILKIIALIAVSPLISGVITKIKNNLRFRRGPGIFQPYYNLAKYFSKDEVVSVNASWIFRAAPYIVLASAVTALVLAYGGELIAVIFVLSLGRFFLALAGLDPATTFGGMGSSREMFISSFVEPVLILAVLAVCLTSGSTQMGVISSAGNTSAALLVCAALVLVTIAETSRIPIDNQETHLELTMIHEAMVLEYSGRSLALMELAAYVKQMLFFVIISMVLLPAFGGAAYIILKVLLISVVIAVTEVLLAKMRLFRVVDFLSFAGILSVLAVIAIVLGV
jgi:formate hydrogenlyase subunit 4